MSRVSLYKDQNYNFTEARKKDFKIQILYIETFIKKKNNEYKGSRRENRHIFRFTKY